MTTFVKQAMTGAAEVSSRRMATILARRRIGTFSIAAATQACT
jgi:hypothetical protein